MVDLVTKVIFITGGVMSGLGKGTVAASIAKILQFRGFAVSMVKCDPYLNVDAGTMNPIEHGENFVCENIWEFTPAKGFTLAGGITSENQAIMRDELADDIGYVE